jgi:uncharacterized protein YrrD
MSERTDVLPVSGLVGRSVLSLATGNKLGVVSDVFLDALNGEILGFTINAPDGTAKTLSFVSVHSFGHPNVRDLIGTKVISETGSLIGQIAGVFVTGESPAVFYEIRESLLDALLGRRHFIPASAGHALSDDKERLIVPNEAAENAAASIDDLLNGPNAVRTFAPREAPGNDVEDTVVILPDEDETVVRRDDDETVLRWRPRG